MWVVRANGTRSSLAWGRRNTWNRWMYEIGMSPVKTLAKQLKSGYVAAAAATTSQWTISFLYL